MKIPNELLYTRSHEWIQKLDETSARVGVTLSLIHISEPTRH